MAPRTVDVVAVGPPPADPYAPAATAWSIAAVLALRGDRVRVLYPEGPAGVPPPPDVVGTAVPWPLRHPGDVLEPAEFAGLVGRRVRPDATHVVRDPSGLGPLGIGGRRSGPPVIVSFVRGLELHAFDRERSVHAPAGFTGRLDSWRDRRAVRRLERAALAEPTALFSDDPELTKALSHEYGLDPRLLRPTVPPVPRLPPAPPREKARAALGIPTDVPVVVAPSASEDPAASGVDRVREAFRRIRSLFPGVRLVVVGAPAPVEPGVVGAPGRDLGTLALALAASDVAVVAPPAPRFDAGAVFAMQAGVATILGAGVRLPSPAAAAVRTAASDDPGDLASALAELVADPALARGLAGRGPAVAAEYLPERVADQVDRAIAGPLA